MRRRWASSAPAVVLIGALLAGCSSLKARMLAQEAVRLYHKGQVALAAARFAEAEELAPSIAPIQLDLGFASLAVYQANPRSPEGRRAATQAIRAFQNYLRLRPSEER